jgi:hypothetical protein
MKNFWNQPITTPLEMVKQSILKGPLQAGASRIFADFGIPQAEVSSLVNAVWNTTHIEDLTAFDRHLQKLLIGRLREEKIRELLDARAVHVAGQIRPHLTGDSLLDVGAGDGMVAWNIREQFRQHALVDVVDYLDSRVQLPFFCYSDGEALPVSEPHEFTMLINVLHHSLNPEKLLLETWRRTARRLLVIESVSGDPNRLGGNELPFSLGVDEQFQYTSFFDWFYNRVLHSDIPVPFNFAPPPVWEDLFARNQMRLTHRKDLGIDVEIVPIHHYLFVLDR